MPLSWNEIKSRAAVFSHEWKDTVREEADAKPFLVEFLNIFGISQKRVATFEHRVKKLDQASGYIDLLWPGTLLVEMKSRGQDLDKAYNQARAYCHGLKDHELPKLILISDFNHFHVYSENGLNVKFELPQLIENLQIFEELAGYQKRNYYDEDPVNIAAAELMGKLHDQLLDVGYSGSALEAYLVRLLFILFADDSTIFQNGIFYDYLEQRTREDGSDLAMHLDQLFQVLDTPEDKRFKTLDEQLNLFPYVNGRLFSERLPTAAFNSEMRQILLNCCKLDWGKISPAIFGSLFQSVMDSTARRNLGAHYTSEKNIMKLIKPLFLDELWEEFHAAGENHNKLRALHGKISMLRFLDPACGCGNFLITAYRELRLLELAIVEKLLKGQLVTNINQYFLVDLDQFYGIELGEFPSQIAGVAMFLIDHQCNMMVSDRFGEYIPLIPLQKSAIIVNANALRLDWQSIIKPLEGEVEEPRFHYILGNPPFVGAMVMNETQRLDMENVFKNSIKGYGVLDYVSSWYKRASEYMSEYSETQSAFVSTNSVFQGEQVGILWKYLSNELEVSIDFAHQTFRWSNEAKGKAAVHCVIVGFSLKKTTQKWLYTYDDINAEPTGYKVSNINNYLVEGPSVIIENRSNPLCSVPSIRFGSMPRDGGNFIMSVDEKKEFIIKEPSAEKWIKPYVGAQEFINRSWRYCLWLVGISPMELRTLLEILSRVEKVKKFRQESSASSTRKFADTPTIFCQIAQPADDYLLIPSVSSERRKYIPIGMMDKSIIANNLVFTCSGANKYHFGVLTSIMHMSWIRYTCGRLKSDYRYSKDIVYNNFPWPEAPTDKQKQAVEEAAQAVLDARAQFPESSLADLYDPNTMPPVLVRAHQHLDKAVDLCYRPQPFVSEAKRIEYLFELYEKYTGGMFVPEKKGKKSKVNIDE
ncbi:MAG: hypothetical protein RLZZ172_481 [Bacteroidota bacterium]|jgi:hypothetical protein